MIPRRHTTEDFCQAADGICVGVVQIEIKVQRDRVLRYVVDSARVEMAGSVVSCDLRIVILSTRVSAPSHCKLATEAFALLTDEHTGQLRWGQICQLTATLLSQSQS